MKKTFRVNLENIPDELQPLVKEEMTKDEVAMLGTVIMKMKYEKFKNKLMGWWYERKPKIKNRKEV
jgi:DNA primase